MPEALPLAALGLGRIMVCVLIHEWSEEMPSRMPWASPSCAPAPRMAPFFAPRAPKGVIAEDVPAPLRPFIHMYNRSVRIRGQGRSRKSYFCAEMFRACQAWSLVT